jgi:hypothetical protein
LFDIRLRGIDRELEALRESQAAIRSNQTLTEEERVAALEAADAREAQLIEEKKKRERTAFLVSQAIALAEVGLNLAREISLINLAAAQLNAIPPPGVLGTAYAASNIPRAIASAAAQGALILAQTIPAFFKGKGPLDNYEGPGLVGEKRPEVIVTERGDIIPITQPEVRHIGKDDLIVPSFTQFRREFNDPSSSVAQRLHKTIEKDTQSRIEMDYYQMEKAMTRALKKASIRVSADVRMPKPRRRW